MSEAASLSALADRCEQEDQSDSADNGEGVTSLYEDHRGPDREDGVLEILIAAVFQRTRLQTSDSRRFRIRRRRTAIRTKADARGNIGSAGTRH